MSKSIVIAIDVWPQTDRMLVESIIRITNLIKPEAFLLATYGKDGKRPEYQNYHPFIKDRIQVYTEELIPETYKNGDFKSNFTNRHIDKKSLQNILLLEKLYVKSVLSAIPSSCLSNFLTTFTTVPVDSLNKRSKQ